MYFRTMKNVVNFLIKAKLLVVTRGVRWFGNVFTKPTVWKC